MTASDVVEVLDRLDAAGLWYCVAGGWGVDALLGEQTREHGNLDVGIRFDQLEQVSGQLPDFRRDDCAFPELVAFARHDGRRMRAYLVAFDPRGDGWQINTRGLTWKWPRDHIGACGRIAGREVRCLTAERQLYWHSHVGEGDLDWADVIALCRRFDLEFRPGPQPGFGSRAPD